MRECNLVCAFLEGACDVHWRGMNSLAHCRVIQPHSHFPAASLACADLMEKCHMLISSASPHELAAKFTKMQHPTQDMV